jgi:hypothetical protein
MNMKINCEFGANPCLGRAIKQNSAMAPLCISQFVTGTTFVLKLGNSSGDLKHYSMGSQKMFLKDSSTILVMLSVAIPLPCPCHSNASDSSTKHCTCTTTDRCL